MSKETQPRSRLAMLRNRVRGTSDAPVPRNEPVLRAYFPTVSESVGNWIRDRVSGTIGDRLGTAAHFVLSGLDPTEYGRSLHGARMSIARARENPTPGNVANAAVDAGLNMLGLWPGSGGDVAQSIFVPIARSRGRDAAIAAHSTLDDVAAAQKPAHGPAQAFGRRLSVATDDDVNRIVDDILSFTPTIRKDSEVSPIQRALWERHKAFASGTGHIMDEVLGSPSINPHLLERVRQDSLLPKNLMYHSVTGNPPQALTAIMDRHIAQFNTVPQVTKLGNLLDYPDLYGLYPDLQDIPVALSTSLPPKNLGTTVLHPTDQSITPAITLNVRSAPKASPMDNTRQLSTLLHELQHVINNRATGFFPASGLFHTANAYFSDVDEVLARNAALREILQKQRALPPNVSPVYTEDLPREKQIFRPTYKMPDPIPKRAVYPAAF